MKLKKKIIELENKIENYKPKTNLTFPEYKKDNHEKLKKTIKLLLPIPNKLY
jgi:hypothetical protein